MARRPLTRKRILRTAVAVADREGLDGVTVRRLAEQLGVHPSSLYNHVAGKGEILDGIVETLMQEAALPQDVTWQEWVRRFAAAFRQLARAHPGAFFVFSRLPVRTPEAVRPIEDALAILRKGGFEPEEAYHAVVTTALGVIGFGLQETLVTMPSPPETDPNALPRDDFPLTHAVAPFGTDPDTDRRWAYLTEVLITGIEQRHLRRHGDESAARW